MNHDIEVLFDGECPLCLREINMLKRLDRRQRIVFTDIMGVGFRAEDYGLTWEQVMSHIRGRLPDGTLIEGVEVFRRLYAAVGFGAIVRLTRLPGISQLLDFGYHHFAKNRLRFTGRCGPDGACPLPNAKRT